MADGSQQNDPVAWANARSQDMGMFGQMGLQGAISQLIQALMQVAGGFGASQGASATAARLSMPAVLSGLVAGPGVPGSPTAMLAGRAQMQLALGASFGDIQGAGGGGFGGRGMGIGAMAGGAGMMEGMTGSGATDMSMEDMTQMTMAGGAGGFTRGITSMRQARAQIKSMVNTVKELQQELGQTITEISQELNTMHSMGYTSHESAGAGLRNLMVSSGVAGINPDQMAGLAQQIGSTTRGLMDIPMRHATGAVIAGAAHIGAAARSGSLSQEMLMDATGQAGEGGVMALTARMAERSVRQMDSSQNQYMLAAFMDPTTGGMDRNAVNRFMGGGMNAQELQRAATRNIQALGPDGYAKWLGMMPQMQGEFQEATGHMGGLGFAAMAAREHGIDLNPNDPAAMARFQRVGRFGSIAEARAGAALISNFETTQETAVSEARIQGGRQAADAERSRRMAEASPDAWVNRLIGNEVRSASRFMEEYVQATSNKVLEITSAPTTSVDVRGALAVANTSVFGPPGVGQARGAGLAADPGQRLYDLRAENVAAQVRIRDMSGISEERRNEMLGEAAAVGNKAETELLGALTYDSAAYWGGDRRSERTAEQIQGTAGLMSRGAGAFRGTQEARAELNRQGLNVATNLAGGRERGGQVASALGMGSEELQEALKKQTFVEILAGRTKEQRGAAYDILYGGLSAEHQALTRGEAEGAVGAFTAYRGTSNLPLGELDIASGSAGAGTLKERELANAVSGITTLAQGIGFTGGQATGVAQRLLGDPTSTAALLRVSTRDFKNLGELVNAAELSTEKQKELFGDVDLSKVGTDAGAMREFLGSVGTAYSSAIQKDLKEGGWLSDQVSEVYKRNMETPGQVGRVASGMQAAVDLLSTNVEGARQAGGAVFENLVGMGERDFREVEKALGFAAGGATFQEADKVRRAVRRGGRGGRGGRDITLDELGGMGITTEQLVGRGMDASMLTEEGIKGVGSQQALRDVLGKWAMERGEMGEQQQQKESPSNPLVVAFQEGFAGALRAHGPIAVTFDDKSTGGEATNRPDGESEPVGNK